MESGTDPRTPGARGTSRWWWALGVVAVVVGLGLLVVQPWEGIETEPVVTGTHAPETSAPASPTSTPSPTPTTPAPPTGADAKFDATTLTALFVTPEQLVAGVPAASPEVQPDPAADEATWGLPEGAVVTPAECAPAVTVVKSKPAAYDARAWLNTTFSFEQSVTLLPSAASAQAAFGALVTTIDACPAFTTTTADGALDPWHAEPAIEGQGVFPSIVQQVARGTEQVPGYHGQMLVGNAIVTWTASAPGGADVDAALATLGDELALSSIVQKQAVAAVASLG